MGKVAAVIVVATTISGSEFFYSNIRSDCFSRSSRVIAVAAVVSDTSFTVTVS